MAERVKKDHSVPTQYTTKRGDNAGPDGKRIISDEAKSRNGVRRNEKNLPPVGPDGKRIYNEEETAENNRRWKERTGEDIHPSHRS